MRDCVGPFIPNVIGGLEKILSRVGHEKVYILKRSLWLLCGIKISEDAKLEIKKGWKSSIILHNFTIRKGRNEGKVRFRNRRYGSKSWQWLLPYTLGPLFAGISNVFTCEMKIIIQVKRNKRIKWGKHSDLNCNALTRYELNDWI